MFLVRHATATREYLLSRLANVLILSMTLLVPSPVFAFEAWLDNLFDELLNNGHMITTGQAVTMDGQLVVPMTVMVNPKLRDVISTPIAQHGGEIIAFGSGYFVRPSAPENYETHRDFLKKLTRLRVALDIIYRDGRACFYLIPSRFRGSLDPSWANTLILPLRWLIPRTDEQLNLAIDPGSVSPPPQQANDDILRRYGAFAIFAQESQFLVHLPLPTSQAESITSVHGRFVEYTGSLPTAPSCEDRIESSRLLKSNLPMKAYSAFAYLPPETVAQRVKSEADRSAERHTKLQTLLQRHHATDLSDMTEAVTFLKNPYAYQGKKVMLHGAYEQHIGPSRAIVNLVAPALATPHFVQWDTERNLAELAMKKTPFVRCVVNVLGTTVVTQGLISLTIPHVKEVECLP